MAGFKLDLFKGIRPRISALKLPRGEAQTAENVDLGSGDIDPWFDKATDQAVTAGRNTRTIHRFDNGDYPAVWFEWDDYVDVARGPVKDDSLERTYYTGDAAGTGAPKMTTTLLATGLFNLEPAPYPANWVYLGVPAPVTAPTVTVPQLPEDVDAEDRFVPNGGLKSTEMVINHVDWTVDSDFAGHVSSWELNAAAAGNINFEATEGTSFRVLSIINANKVTLESATTTGIFARTLNFDKTTVNDWQPMDSFDGANEADFVGWTLPVGVTATIINHRLAVGDVISVTKLQIQLNFATALGVEIYEQDWDAPALDETSTFFQVTNARITSAFSPDPAFSEWDIGGSFYYQVDRAASTVDSTEDRAYVYTYVTDLGEEGPPSPPSTVQPMLDTVTVQISDMALPPTIGYVITSIRLYRTNSTEIGTEYQFVKEISVNTVTTDSTPSAELGEILNTTTWDPPPIDMLGITEMPNGMMVGFAGKNLYFCEPYFPHAWPAEYDQAIGYQIVGIAPLGNSLAVMTKGPPYIVTGSHPRNVNVRSTKVNQACVNKESIATDGDNVYYASPDGLVEISINGIRVATEDYIRKKEWESYTPTEMIGSFHEGRYYGFYAFDVSAIDPVISAEVSGTISTADEDQIIAGGLTIILTLQNDIWLGAATFDAQRQNIIDGLTASTDQTLGWNNIVRDTDLDVGDVVRTSDTVVTITLPASPTYAVTQDEVIQPTIPATALQNSSIAVNTGSTFSVTALSPAATLQIGGTAAGALESEIVTGGKTVTLTVTNDTWVDGASFDAQRQGIIDLLIATTNQTNGWNNEVPNEIALTDVVRTSDLIVTITLPAIADYVTVTDESVYGGAPNGSLTTTAVPLSSLMSIAILSEAGAPSALFSGTITTAVESEIVTGGLTIIITLTDDTWIAAGTGPIGTIAETDSIIDALIATASETLGWNNVVVPGIETTDLVRNSNTVATITLDAEATYQINSSEAVGMDIPNEVLVTSVLDLTVANTFGILAQQPAQAYLGGALVLPTKEVHIVLGGRSLTITLVSDTWKAAASGPIGETADTQAIIDGLVSAQSEGSGWNVEVIAALSPSDIVRTTDTVATIIAFPAVAGYAITADEVITCTVPVAALNFGIAPIVASPVIDIAEDVPVTAVLSGTCLTSTAGDIRDQGCTVILTLAEDSWAASGATFNAQRQAIIDGLDSNLAEGGGWDAQVKNVLDVTAVERTNNSVVTITVPATPGYIVTTEEIITATVPEEALFLNLFAVDVVASPTFALDEALVTKVMVVTGPKVTTTTREVYVAIAEDSFTDWTEYAVDTDTPSTADYTDSDVMYYPTSDRWVVLARNPDLLATNSESATMHTSDDDGDTWTERTLPAGAVTLFNSQGKSLYWNETNDILLAQVAAYLALIYSTDGGVTWLESAAPWAGISLSFTAAEPLQQGGDDFAYSQGFAQSIGGGAYEYYGVVTGDLSVGPLDPWAEFQLTFDGSIDHNSTARPVSAGGKTYWILPETIAASNYDMYISSVNHPGGTTETYVGMVSGSFKGTFQFAAASPTNIVLLDSDGYITTCTVAGAGTASNWNFPTAASDIIASWFQVQELIYDPGDPSKDGLGFICVGRHLSTGLGRIYTSPDGAVGNWTLQETLSLADTHITGVAASNLADVS